jgi:hypothetical protein
LDERLRRHPQPVGGRARRPLDHEAPSPRRRLRATPAHRRSLHPHRRVLNPRQALAKTLLKHALSASETFLAHHFLPRRYQQQNGPHTRRPPDRAPPIAAIAFANRQPGRTPHPARRCNADAKRRPPQGPPPLFRQGARRISR